MTNCNSRHEASQIHIPVLRNLFEIFTIGNNTIILHVLTSQLDNCSKVLTKTLATEDSWKTLSYLPVVLNGLYRYTLKNDIK